MAPDNFEIRMGAARVIQTFHSTNERTSHTNANPEKTGDKFIGPDGFVFMSEKKEKTEIELLKIRYDKTRITTLDTQQPRSENR